MGGYQALFTISFYHSFYTNDLWAGLTIEPDKETQQFLSKYNMLWQVVNNEFTLYYHSVDSNPGFLEYVSSLREDDPLVIHFSVSESNFPIITDVPLSWKGQLLYSTKNAKSDVESSELLTEFSSECTGSTGKICLYFKEFLQENGTTKPKSYSIRMKARATMWRYIIVNRTGFPANQLRIKSSDGIVFSGPTEVTTPSGEVAWQFSSGLKTFPFSESPEKGFDLVQDMNVARNQYNTLIKGLSTASRTNLQVDQAEGNNSESIYSAIYVYV